MGQFVDGNRKNTITAVVGNADILSGWVHEALGTLVVDSPRSQLGHAYVDLVSDPGLSEGRGQKT